MEVHWSKRALSDLDRLSEFVRSIRPGAAQKIMKSLLLAVQKLSDHPRLGEKLFDFSSNEIRRLFIGKYELRYELSDTSIYILRIWHTREQRTVTPNTAE